MRISTPLPLPPASPAYVGHDSSACSASLRSCAPSGCFATADMPSGALAKTSGAIQRQVSQSAHSKGAFTVSSQPTALPRLSAGRQNIPMHVWST